MNTSAILCLQNEHLNICNSKTSINLHYALTGTFMQQTFMRSAVYASRC